MKHCLTWKSQICRGRFFALFKIHRGVFLRITFLLYYTNWKVWLKSRFITTVLIYCDFCLIIYVHLFIKVIFETNYNWQVDISLADKSPFKQSFLISGTIFSQSSLGRQRLMFYSLLIFSIFYNEQLRELETNS